MLTNPTSPFICLHTLSHSLLPSILTGAALALALAASGGGASTRASGTSNLSSGTSAPKAPLTTDAAYSAASTAAKKALRAKHGDSEGARIDRGVDQVLSRWRREDGDAAAFGAFVQVEFVPAGEKLDALFGRFEFATERIGGYLNSLERDLRKQLDLDLGPMLPIDERFGAFNVGAHLSDDMFGNKIAFVALLNFPLTTLDQRLKEGMKWSRVEWAETRLAHQFASRIPADVLQRLSEAYSSAGTYVSSYNIYMHHVLTEDGRRLFPEGLRLLNHWNLRDDLKARYADPNGMPMQKMIALVMDRIVRQEIPGAVVNNPLLDWIPATNAVAVSKVSDAKAPEGAKADPVAARENDERYRQWMGIFKAERLVDPWTPENPSHIARRFNVNREIPEPEVRALLESVLTSPLGERVGRLIEKRLGRPLEPFDIWYVGFKPRGKYAEPELDALTKKKYPTPAAYAADMPRLLRDLGFSAERAQFLADHIEVDPARGSGHALGATRRDDKAHLRTRVGEGGMDYKGYNIAIHEMGHNIEQVFSNTTIDHTLLSGVPNTAFTEALAFVFQARDLELLGLTKPDADSETLRALEEFWATREIAGVALVDMGAWRWMYDHDTATPAEFRAAVVGIAQDIWNRYDAPIFKTKDVTLLGIYAHMVDSGMYIPDYPLGHLIAFQVEAHFRSHAGSFGAEFERICQLGSITPDAWMRQAVGAPLSVEPLLTAAASAVKSMGE